MEERPEQEVEMSDIKTNLMLEILKMPSSECEESLWRKTTFSAIIQLERIMFSTLNGLFDVVALAVVLFHPLILLRSRALCHSVNFHTVARCICFKNHTCKTRTFKVE